MTIESPAGVSDPNQGTIVVGDKADVVCIVKKSTDAGAAEVDPSSVKLEVLDASDVVVSEVAGTPAVDDPEKFAASFVVTTIANGVISFRCSAADLSATPKIGSDTVDTFVDHGPEIKVTTPAADSAYALAGAVPFVFEVAPAPVAANDAQAAVSDVSLVVNGVDFEPTVDATKPNGYKLSINFNDTTKFPQAPSGSVPVVIGAKNNRAQGPVERLLSYHFDIDGSGPTITVTSHKDQQIIGGKVVLEFSVVDAISAVDTNTVSVSLNQTENLYGTNGLWTQVGDDFSFTFDSLNVSGSTSQVTVNIKASDVAGNPSSGASLILHLDNFPPIVDLDAGNVRVRKKSGNVTLCSKAFDPLGPWAADDHDVILPFTHFRALVWDQTNFVQGQTVTYMAGTDTESVDLYLQPDAPTIPLLIDNDKDGTCDALATTVGGVPLPSLELAGVNPSGNAWFGPDDGGDPTEPALSGCLQGTEGAPPAQLCMGYSDLTTVIRHDSATVEKVIYGIGGLQGLECTGSGWEIGPQLVNATQKEGWFCLAAMAKDKVGNVGISPPLRVCYDNPGTTAKPSCAIQSELGPPCTDSCTPPAGFGHTILAVH